MATENIDIVVKEIGATETANSMKRIGTDAAAAAAPVGGLNSAIEGLKGTLISLGLLLSGKQILDMADHYTVVIDKLKKYATSNEDLIQTEQKLNDIALATRQRMDEVASVYTGLARASRGAGVSQKELLEATTSISKAMTTMGASAGDVSEVMKRLAFSMQSGMQPGRAIAQLFIQFPALSDAISKELGISAKEFLNMAHSGQLSMKQIVDAMASAGQEGKTLSNAFNATTVTLSSAFTTLGGQVARAIGLFDQGSGVSRAFAESVMFLAKHIDDVLALVRAFSVGLAAYAIATYAASAATVTFAGALTAVVGILSRPAVIIAAVAAAVSLLITYFKDFELTANGSVTAMGVLVGAFNLLKEAASFILDNVLKPLGAWILNSPGAFAAAAVAVTAFAAAMSVAVGSAILLGIGNLIFGIAGLTAGFFSLTAAIAPAVLGIVGFTAAVVAGIAITLKLMDAIGLTKNAYQDFANMLESTANAALQKVTDTVKTATDEVKKHALSQVEVKAKTGEAAQTAADASQAWFRSSDAFKEVHKEADGAASSIKSLQDSYLTGASDADKFAAETEKLTAALVAQGSRADEQARKMAIAKGEAVDAERAAHQKMMDDYAAEFDAANARIDQLHREAVAATLAGNAAHAAANQAWADRMRAQQVASAGSVGQSTPLSDALGRMRGEIAKISAQADLASALETLGQFSPNGSSTDLRNQVAVMQAKLALFMNLVNTTDMFQQGTIPLGLRDMMFATGGTFMVGGNGGTDSQRVSFMASPDEEVTVRTPAQQRAGRRSGGGDIIIVNVHGVQDTRDFNRNMGQIASKVRSQLSRRT